MYRRRLNPTIDIANEINIYFADLLSEEAFFNVLKTSDYWQGGQDCIGTKDTFVRADYIERGTLPSQELLEEFREGFSTDPQTMYHFETSSNYESVIVLIELLKKLQAKFPRCATLEQESLIFGDDIQRIEPGMKW